MTSFIWEQKPYLLVADIGDNFALRGQVPTQSLQNRTLRNLPDARLTPGKPKPLPIPTGPETVRPSRWMSSREHSGHEQADQANRAVSFAAGFRQGF